MSKTDDIECIIVIYHEEVVMMMIITTEAMRFLTMENSMAMVQMINLLDRLIFTVEEVFRLPGEVVVNNRRRRKTRTVERTSGCEVLVKHNGVSHLHSSSQDYYDIVTHLVHIRPL